MPARSQPGVKAPYPAFIVPALASAATRVPAGERWIHEVKFDGYRVQLHVVHEAIKVFTRRGHNWTQSGRELACAGKVEHGFSRADVTDVLGRLKPLVQKARPFKDTKRRPHAVWVKPALLAEVEYRAQSEAGKVRHPSFKGAARGSVTWISSTRISIDSLMQLSRPGSRWARASSRHSTTIAIWFFRCSTFWMTQTWWNPSIVLPVMTFRNCLRCPISSGESNATTTTIASAPDPRLDR